MLLANKCLQMCHTTFNQGCQWVLKKILETCLNERSDQAYWSHDIMIFVDKDIGKIQNTQNLLNGFPNLFKFVTVRFSFWIQAFSEDCALLIPKPTPTCSLIALHPRSSVLSNSNVLPQEGVERLGRAHRRLGVRRRDECRDVRHLLTRVLTLGSHVEQVAVVHVLR